MSYDASVDAWIDMYHLVRRLARQDTLILLTDNAIGQAEEENLAHLTANLAGELAPSRIIPFLTAKHSLDYIQLYAARAASHGFEALTVVGGDPSGGPPRCFPHAYLLRRWLRRRVPSLGLGGWVNPLRDPVEQVDFLLHPEFEAEFFLTQIVSHHSVDRVERFVTEARRRGVPYPGVFGVFLYRSANPRTLQQLGSFFPVPAEGVTRDFAEGLSPEEICARSIRALREVGVDKVYISNLGFERPDTRYRKILDLV
jgi:5,10-methylenetetrahydrofolate reductase